jgi:7-cyano-7-deazaguanine synthase
MEKSTLSSTFDSVLLLSGGLDSAANLAFSHEAGKKVLGLNIHYGQRASVRERAAALKLTEYYGAEFHELDLSFLGRLGGSSLTEATSDVPTINANQLDDPGVTEKTAKSVWVPNRNGLFIQAAAAFAERNQAREILVGFNREEASTFPDNSSDFMEASSAALFYSTQNHVRVGSYTDRLDKREIVQSLRALKKKPFPFHLVWSCYHAGASACGECESCQRFRRATREE